MYKIGSLLLHVTTAKETVQRKETVETFLDVHKWGA